MWEETDCYKEASLPADRMLAKRKWNASKSRLKCKQIGNEIQANQKPWEWTSLMSISDKLLIRKRAIIEMINDELKNLAQVE